jgi:hypothetical protein
LLLDQERTGYCDKTVPFRTALISNENPGFILRIGDILKNGDLSKQVSVKGAHLFAVNDCNAIAYEVSRTGKSQFTAKVYYNEVDRDDANDISSWWQIMDIYSGLSWPAVFRCPGCNQDVDELLITYKSCRFACVPCLTALDPKEARIYQRTLTARQRKDGQREREWGRKAPIGNCSISIGAHSKQLHT